MGEPEAASYSGPTYVTNRSGKHSSATAISHAENLGPISPTAIKWVFD